MPGRFDNSLAAEIDWPFEFDLFFLAVSLGIVCWPFSPPPRSLRGLALY